MKSTSNAEFSTEMWPELKLPPLNLWSAPPSDEMIALHASWQDPTLWEDYEEE